MTRKEAMKITRDVIETERDWKAAAFAWARNADQERAQRIQLEEALEAIKQILATMETAADKGAN